LLCGKSFVWSNKANKRRQESTWFHKWIKEGYSVRQLSSISGYHPDKLRDIIHANLVLSAPVCTDFAECHHLLCDGTFIEGRKHGLFVVMGAGSNKVVAGKYDVKEKQSDLVLWRLKDTRNEPTKLYNRRKPSYFESFKNCLA
jgi:hypothetical protein